MLRRSFLTVAATALNGWAAGKALSRKERVDLALAGKEVDRPPFSFWLHFGLNTPEAHAKKTLEFHRLYRTDIVKVMSDFPYPKAAGAWYQLKPEANPFPQQIKALELIRDGLRGDAYYIETLFNPWNVAQKLSSKDEVLRLMREKPQALLDALEAITQSEINHVKRVLKVGAAGVLVSVANANRGELSPDDYRKFSAPFDRRILDVCADAKLTMLHLHVEREYLDLFAGWRAPVVNYSHVVSKIPIAEMKTRFPSVMAGGIDEVNYRKLDANQLREQWKAASAVAGKKFILTPGCSVPNESTAEELARLPAAIGA